MNKKVIALILSCVMLFSASPAVAAADEPVKPSIEEILNDYHQKAFEAQSAEDAGEATTYSNRSGGKTLEQETVDTLNAAGYEAYNVTASNYDALEAELNTDFASLGLNPNGSYIIVISGEDENEIGNPNARLGNFPVQDFIDDGSSNIIRYTYDGVEYKLRRIYLTSTTEPDLFVRTKFELSNIRNISDYVNDILDATLSIGIDHVANKVVPKLPLSTILGLMFDWTTNDALTIMEPGDLTIYAYSLWSRDYLQVFNPNNNSWYTAHYVSKAETKAYCDGGYVLNHETGEVVRVVGNEHSTTTYSIYYDDLDARKAIAVEAFLGNYIFYCGTWDIDFYLVGKDGQINFTGDTDPLFSHKQPVSDYLPRIEFN